MKKLSIVAGMLAACCGAAIAAGPPFEAFKGKMKEGLYEYKMETEMPGMPGGMGKHSNTIEHCVTGKDLESGNWAKGKQQQDCDFQDVKVSGNGATYKMVCKGQMPMTADVKVSFANDKFTSDTKMTMEKGPTGQPMTMTQHMVGTYKGPCNK